MEVLYLTFPVGADFCPRFPTCLYYVPGDLHEIAALSPETFSERSNYGRNVTMPLKDFNEILDRELADPEFVQAYLNSEGEEALRT